MIDGSVGCAAAKVCHWVLLDSYIVWMYLLMCICKLYVCILSFCACSHVILKHDVTVDMIFWSLPQAPDHHILELHIKPDYHRFLIGRQGASITRVREQFGAHVVFPRKYSDDDSDVVTVIGTKEKAEAAKAHLQKLVKELVS